MDIKNLSVKTQHIVLGISGALALILMIIPFAVGRNDLLPPAFSVAILLIFLPYSYFSYTSRKEIEEIEDQLPAFLRDIAESRKSGLTLPQAVSKSSKTDYGVLSKYVRKMAVQLSWGVPFIEALRRFSRKSRSRFVQRAIAIIIETQMSGGALSETLDAVANDARIIKEAEAERKTKLQQQTVIMYAIFFLFLMIVISLQKLLVPLVFSRGFTIASIDPEAVLSFYQGIFFSMVVIQAIFTGLIAGQIAEDSVKLGLKHSAIFLVTGVMASWIFLF
ncbi:MAG: type II secretion system F family protein [archaeon]|jgi:flagellar protein FlaJ|nr:hypothetical protein [Euryarchaeota archaeon]MDP7260420.1 type II secretion system F family protein [archaeon]HIK01102.1 type II secretion system F family protein [Candidatus Undinarchaeales archaeon ERR594346 U_76725]|tara:strand:+ start:87658 stop:88488 length:831 start_codon:yes stop_codon:yes gene_type:complete